MNSGHLPAPLGSAALSGVDSAANIGTAAMVNSSNSRRKERMATFLEDDPRSPVLPEPGLRAAVRAELATVLREGVSFFCRTAHVVAREALSRRYCDRDRRPF